jgi:hypothetical protein
MRRKVRSFHGAGAATHNGLYSMSKISGVVEYNEESTKRGRGGVITLLKNVLLIRGIKSRIQLNVARIVFVFFLYPLLHF